MNVALESINAFPDQCQQAWDDCKGLVVSEGYDNIKNVVVCGMGGSRFTPLSIKECFKDKIKVSYEICDEYKLPKYVNKNTLVILSSYSGNTEEVLTCGEQAEQMSSKIAVITNGGNLAVLAKEKGYFSYIFDEKYNPSHQPRLGVGYMLFGHLALLSKLNLIDLSSSEVEKTIEKARRFDVEGVSKNLSKKMQDKEIFVITSEHLRGFVNGFANQINENAKTMSSFRYISELNHHLMEGLSNPKESKSKWLFIFFKSTLFDSRILRRFDITKDIVEKQSVASVEVELSGESRLLDILEAYKISGLSTYNLSLYNKVDPTKIPWVDYFKEKLSETP